MVSVTEILKTLPALSAEDLAKIDKHLAALHAKAPRTTVARDDALYLDTSNDWLLGGIVHELTMRGQGQLIPKGFAITKAKSFRGYAKHGANVRAWLLSSMRREMSKNERIYLGRVAAGCLADLIEMWDHPVVLHMMLHNTARIPEAVMRQFPGYAEAGLMGWILRGARKGA